MKNNENVKKKIEVSAKKIIKKNKDAFKELAK